MLDRINLEDRMFDLVSGFAPELPSTPADARYVNLSDAGLTSMAAVRLMLAIEAAFTIAIPDAELTPENFATIHAIVALVARLQR